MSTMDWVLVAVQGLVVIGFIALGVRSGGIGIGLWGGVGTLVLVFVFGLDPGRAADQRDPDHHRGDLGCGGDGGRRRRRLHGQDRQCGAARQAVDAQLCRPIRLVRPHDPHRDRQHLLLDHPGDQRDRLREQDPTGAPAGRIHGRVGSRDHLEPRRGRNGHDAASRRDLPLRPRRRAADHGPGEHRRHLRDVARDEPPRQGPRGRRGVPAPGGRRRGDASCAGGRNRAEALREAQRRHLPGRRSRDLPVRLRRGHPARRWPPKAAASSRCRSRR